MFSLISWLKSAVELEPGASELSADVQAELPGTLAVEPEPGALELSADVQAKLLGPVAVKPDSSSRLMYRPTCWNLRL